MEVSPDRQMDLSWASVLLERLQPAGIKTVGKVSDMGSVERVGDSSGMESAEDEEAVTEREIAQRILQRCVGMTTPQNRSQSETLAALPPPVRRRLRALKNLQLSVTNLEANFYQEVHALEMKYMRLYYPFFNKRRDIVTGTYEPKDAECQWESDGEELADGLEKAAITENDKAPEPDNKKEDENVQGIPEFWLTIFKNVSLLAEMMQEHDEPIINHLEDIKVILLERDPMGFVLEFHFSPNEYFTNLVLTKEYHMKCQPDPDNPFDFEGPEIFKCIGCPINWCKDKNVTVKTIKKKQKHKSRGSVRTITKTVQNDSFFNFFNPPELPSDPSADVAEELQNLLSTDFEIGHYMRERVVPHAVLLFTGEGLDEEDDFEEEEEDGDGSEESSGEEEEEESPAVPKGAVRRKGGRGGKGGAQAGGAGAPALPFGPSECKQQ